MSDIQESILKAFNIQSTNAVKKIDAAVTVDAVVEKLIDEGLGLYEVKYLNNTIKAYSNNIAIHYKVGDVVYLLVPQGDFSKQKIIIGAATPNAAMYQETNKKGASRFLVKSENLLGDLHDLTMNSWTTQKYDVDFSNNNFLNLIPDYLIRSKILALKFKVKTVLDIAQRTSGNYGINITIPIREENKVLGYENYFTKTFTIDINNLLGNPYNFENYTDQTLIIRFDKDWYYDNRENQTIVVQGFTQEFAELAKKRLKHEDILTTEDTSVPVEAQITNENRENIDVVWYTYEDMPGEDDIFIKDLGLYSVIEIPEEDLSGYYLALTGDTGEFFLNADENNIKTLTPRLFINGKETSLKERECYWFVQDASIKNTSEDYSHYGGQGWRCLNEKEINTENSNGANTFTYITNKYEYKVSAADVYTTTDYKCVIVYDKDTVVSQTITITNNISKIKMELVTDSSKYIRNTGKVIATCAFSDENNVLGLDTTIPYCDWHLYDVNGNEYPFVLNNDFVYVEQNEKHQYEENGVTYTYYTTSISFDTNYIINDYAFIGCQLMCSKNGKTVTIGIRKTPLVAVDDIDFLMTVDNSNVIYKYDGSGNSPYTADYDGDAASKIPIQPLQFHIYKASEDGKEFSADEYNSSKVIWYFPKNSLINIRSVLGNAEGFDEVSDNRYFIYTTNGNHSINYEIKPIYSPKENDNTIKLVVIFDSQRIEQNIDIKFIKEGESGTNGTKYSAIVTYRNYAYGAENIKGIPQKLKFVYYEGKWFVHNTDINTLTSAKLEAHPPLNVEVYSEGRQLINDTTEPNGVQYEVQWEMFDKTNYSEKNGNNYVAPFLQVTENGLVLPEKRWDDANDISFNVVRAIVTIKNNNIIGQEQKIYAYYPIEVTRVGNLAFDDTADKMLSEIPNIRGGFSSVLYSSDGKHPKYNSNTPFSCMLPLDDDAREADCEYFYKWYTSSNLIDTGDYADAKHSECKIIPITSYDNADSFNYVKVVISQAENTEVATSIRNFLDNIGSQKQNAVAAEKYYKNIINNWSAWSEQYKVYSTVTGSRQKFNDLLQESRNFLNYRGVCIYTLSNLYTVLNSIIEATATLTSDYNSQELHTVIEEKCNQIKQDIIIVISKFYQLNLINQFNISDFNPPSINELSGNILQAIKEESKIIYDKVENCIISFEAGIISYEQNLVTCQSYSGYNRIPELYKLFSNMKDGMADVDNGFHLPPTDISDEANHEKEFLTKIHNQLNELMLTLSSGQNCYTFNHLQTLIDNAEKTIGVYINNDYYINLCNTRKDVAEALKNTYNVKYEVYKQKLKTATDTIVHIMPVIMLTNIYELSSINEWDGNKLYIDETNAEYLYAPQIGAGQKDTNNRFTGMVMGCVKNADKPKNEAPDIGLFGYGVYKDKQGIDRVGRTLFLDAKTGTSYFGLSGRGQIIVDPTNDKGEIKSGNFNPNAEMRSKFGLTEYTNEIPFGGMLIDFTTPQIIFGNGKFSVDSDGNAILSGGGSAGGWDINNGFLSSGTGDDFIALVSTGDANNRNTDLQFGPKLFSGNHGELTSTRKGFYIGPDGASFGSSIRISAENDGKIFIGNLSFGKYWEISGKYDRQEGANSYIAYGFGNNTPSLMSSDDNSSNFDNKVYFGTDGLGIGSKFKVTAKTGVIEVGRLDKKHWIIDGDNSNSYMYHGTLENPNVNSELNRGDVYIGTDGINIGNNIKLLPRINNNTSLLLGDLTQENSRIRSYWEIGSNDRKAYIGYHTAYINTTPIEGELYHKSVYMGTDGISLGHNKFMVKNDGTLSAAQGRIGGWWMTPTKFESLDIAEEYDGLDDALKTLYFENPERIGKGNVTFYANGTIECKDKNNNSKIKWRLDKDGKFRVGDSFFVGYTYKDINSFRTFNESGWKLVQNDSDKNAQYIYGYDGNSHKTVFKTGGDVAITVGINYPNYAPGRPQNWEDDRGQEGYEPDETMPSTSASSKATLANFAVFHNGDVRLGVGATFRMYIVDPENSDNVKAIELTAEKLQQLLNLLPSSGG